MHGQRVDQLSGCGAERPSLEHGERERSVVGRDVQLQGGVDADQQVDWLDGQLLQPHGVNQRLHRLHHLGDGNVYASHRKGLGLGRCAVNASCDGVVSIRVNVWML